MDKGFLLPNCLYKNVVLYVRQNTERKLNIIVTTLKYWKREKFFLECVQRLLVEIVALITNARINVNPGMGGGGGGGGGAGNTNFRPLGWASDDTGFPGGRAV